LRDGFTFGRGCVAQRAAALTAERQLLGATESLTCLEQGAREIRMSPGELVDGQTATLGFFNARICSAASAWPARCSRRARSLRAEVNAASGPPYNESSSRSRSGTAASVRATPVFYRDRGRRATVFRVHVFHEIGLGLWNAFRMFWEVWWALVLGFGLSGVVQAWIPRTRLDHALGGRGPRQLAIATGLGAASSSCSYAAVAIAKSLFQKGASLASAMAFEFASTNLVFEIGIVMWVFLGWEFTLAEFVGGIFLITLMWAAIRLLVTRRAEEEARLHAQAADAGHEHHTAGTETMTWRERLTSADAWTDVAYNFRGDWGMLWKEISAGFVIAGFVALLPMSFFNGLFLTHASAAPRLLESVVLGPVVAALTFVCSVGNVPLAAVLWAGGISFSGVIAFIYADLIIVPIVVIYGRVYGWKLTRLLVAIMFVTMAAAALGVDGIFSAAGLVPTHRPSIESISSRGIAWNYTTVLDIVFLLVAVAFVGLTVRRGARDPMCGMTVDRRTEHRAIVDGKTFYFCGPGCKRKFEATRTPGYHTAISPGRGSMAPVSGGPTGTGRSGCR
jgi:uncharacterized membrane protein YraQ (UPF0718 family)/YHS domain-containing protein